jgi:hypothetical protein
VTAILNPYLRRVSGSVTLNELGRILARNKFALVDNSKFVTTSDLLCKFVSKPSLAQSTMQPQNKPVSEDDASEDYTLVKKAGMVAALGLTAAAGFFMAKKDK